ncbi:MAG: histidine phosphatase family protein [Pseudomonadota bacterium]
MRIILVRHGESEANVADIVNDDPRQVVSLTGRGKAQAKATAEQLRGIAFTHAYVSEFPRAQQTAAILLRHHDCALAIDARLNERRSGMDGLPVHRFNDLIKPDPLRIKPEHGESFLEQMERLRDFLDAAATHHPHGVVLAVSHENPIMAAQAVAGMDAEQAARGSIANCAWVELTWPTEAMQEKSQAPSPSIPLQEGKGSKSPLPSAEG